MLKTLIRDSFNSVTAVPKRLRRYGIVAQSTICAGVFASVLSAASPVALPASLASLNISPGGTAQLQIFLTAPQSMISGSAVITLDSTIFGNILAADVYSATGDQIGSANIQGRTVDIEFGSQTGGVGRLPGLPVLTVTAPVLASAPIGASTTPVFASGTTSWIDVQGVRYSPTLASGSITIGGSLSIQSVTAAGTVVTINGSGFAANAAIQIDSVAIAATEFVSAQQLKVTLPAPIDLTGHRIAVQNPTGGSATWYYALHGDFSQRPTTGDLSSIQPIFPLQLYSAADDSGDFLFSAAVDGLAFQNPSQNTVTVSLQLINGHSSSQNLTNTVTLAPGASFLQLGSTFVGGQLVTAFHIIPDAPIRIAVVGPSSFHTVRAAYTPSSGAGIYVNGTSQALGFTNPLLVNWTYGTPPPAPITLAVENSSPVQFTVSASKNPWLSVSPQQGISCLQAAAASAPVSCLPPSVVSVLIDPSTLSPGVYDQTLTLTSLVLNSQPTTVPVVLTVAANPNLPSPPSAIAVQSSLSFAAQIGQPAPASQTLDISPTFGTFTLSTQTTSGGTWLSATISTQGVSHGIVSVNPAGLPAGTYQGAITVVTQLGGSGQVPVTLYVYVTPPPVTISPSALSFTAVHGHLSSSQTINVSTGSVSLPLSVGSTTYSTSDSWLVAAPVVTGSVPYPLVQVSTPDAITMTADATNLAIGTYTALLTLIAPTGSGNSATIPVTFTVTAAPQPLAQPGTLPIVTAVLNGASQSSGTLSPGELVTIFGQNFGPAQPAGLSLTSPTQVSVANNAVQVFFNSMPAPLLYVSSIQINAIVPYEITGPVTSISVQYNGTTIPAGDYSVTGASPAIFTLNSAGEGPAAVLNQDSTVNSASNPAARGSIVQIYGTGAGATQPPSATGSVTAASNIQPALPVSVTIGGATATVTYAAEASAEVSGVLQVNAVVPQGLAPGSAIPIVVTVGSAKSQAGAVIAIK